ncbi:hypothetical protein [Dyella lutea]|uniref:Uncharacterized protein n=1 Tax=Dyella lutea TaxID=2950441 RepID=A0ABT1F9X8_9GAMM|nr:hypothetical protein [Dyella lutea]MCP1374181.1 hypothetical protein [Dyella lutea]
MSNDQDDPLCLVFIPALVTLLYKAEQTKGVPLTESEVIAIRDHANCVALPRSMAAVGEKARGYPDIVAEHCWDEWQSARQQLCGQAS